MSGTLVVSAQCLSVWNIAAKTKPPQLTPFTSGHKLPGDYDPYRRTFHPSKEGKERCRAWHRGPDYIVQVKKADWSLKRFVGVIRGDLTPVPLLLEFVDISRHFPSMSVRGVLLRDVGPAFTSDLLFMTRNRCLHLLRVTEVPSGVHAMMLGPVRDLRPRNWGNGPAASSWGYAPEEWRLWRTGSWRPADEEE